MELTNILTPQVVSVELELIKLKKQIEMEKQMCNSLELDLEKCQRNSAYKEEYIHAKTSHKTTLTDAINEAEIKSIGDTSLNVANDFEREMEKIEMLKLFESTRNKLMKQLWNYEKHWEATKNMYYKLPVANDVHTMEEINKKLTLQIIFKRKEIIDTESHVVTRNTITDKIFKVNNVKLAQNSLKCKELLKQKFSKWENKRSLTESNGKIKIEISSLIGKVRKTAPPYILYGRLKTTDGFVVPPPYSSLGKKSITNNMYQKHPVIQYSETPGGSARRIQTPQHMIIKNSPYKNLIHVGVPIVGEVLSGNNDINCCEIVDDPLNVGAKRKRNDITSPPLNTHIIRDHVTNTAQKENKPVEQKLSICVNQNRETACYSISGTSDDKGIKNESTKKEKKSSDKISDRTQLKKHFANIILESGVKTLPNLASKTTKEHGTQNIDYSSVDHKYKDGPSKFGPRIQSMFENKKSEKTLNVLNINSDCTTKSTNVWDIFN